MSELRTLHRRQLVPEAILEDIEAIVADARAGNVTGVFIVADYGPDSLVRRANSFTDRLRAIGALEVMKDSIQRT